MEMDHGLKPYALRMARDVEAFELTMHTPNDRIMKAAREHAAGSHNPGAIAGDNMLLNLCNHFDAVGMPAEVMDGTPENGEEGAATDSIRRSARPHTPNRRYMRHPDDPNPSRGSSQRVSLDSDLSPPGLQGCKQCGDKTNDCMYKGPQRILTCAACHTSNKTNRSDSAIARSAERTDARAEATKARLHSNAERRHDTLAERNFDRVAAAASALKRATRSVRSVHETCPGASLDQHLDHRPAVVTRGGTIHGRDPFPPTPPTLSGQSSSSSPSPITSERRLRGLPDVLPDGPPPTDPPNSDFPQLPPTSSTTFPTCPAAIAATAERARVQCAAMGQATAERITSLRVADERAANEHSLAALATANPFSILQPSVNTPLRGEDSIHHQSYDAHAPSPDTTSPDTHAATELDATERAATELATEQAAAIESATERAQAERTDTERATAERAATYHAAAQRNLANERMAEAATEQADAERADAERADTERADTERADSERADTERANTERANTERADTERADTERANSERADTERADTERADIERADTVRVTDKRLAAVQAAAERVANLQSDTERHTERETAERDTPEQAPISERGRGRGGRKNHPQQILPPPRATPLQPPRASYVEDTKRSIESLSAAIAAAQPVATANPLSRDIHEIFILPADDTARLDRNAVIEMLTLLIADKDGNIDDKWEGAFEAEKLVVHDASGEKSISRLGYLVFFTSADMANPAIQQTLADGFFYDGRISEVKIECCLAADRNNLPSIATSAALLTASSEFVHFFYCRKGNSTDYNLRFETDRSAAIRDIQLWFQATMADTPPLYTLDRLKDYDGITIVSIEYDYHTYGSEREYTVFRGGWKIGYTSRNTGAKPLIHLPFLHMSLYSKHGDRPTLTPILTSLLSLHTADFDVVLANANPTLYCPTHASMGCEGGSKCQGHLKMLHARRIREAAGQAQIKAASKFVPPPRNKVAPGTIKPGASVHPPSTNSTPPATLPLLPKSSQPPPAPTPPSTERTMGQRPIRQGGRPNDSRRRVEVLAGPHGLEGLPKQRVQKMAMPPPNGRRIVPHAVCDFGPRRETYHTPDLTHTHPSSDPSPHSLSTPPPEYPDCASLRPSMVQNPTLPNITRPRRNPRGAGSIRKHNRMRRLLYRASSPRVHLKHRNTVPDLYQNTELTDPSPINRKDTPYGYILKTLISIAYMITVPETTNSPRYPQDLLRTFLSLTNGHFLRTPENKSTNNLREWKLAPRPPLSLYLARPQKQREISKDTTPDKQPITPNHTEYPHNPRTQPPKVNTNYCPSSDLLVEQGIEPHPGPDPK